MATTGNPVGKTRNSKTGTPQSTSAVAGQGVWFHPQTGARSETPQDGYVFVPNGSDLVQGANGTYEVVGRRPNRSGQPNTSPAGFTPYAGSDTTTGALTPDPFDIQIRQAALNNLMLARKSTNRSSTFVTGPRGLQGPFRMDKITDISTPPKNIVDTVKGAINTVVNTIVNNNINPPLQQRVQRYQALRGRNPASILEPG